MIINEFPRQMKNNLERASKENEYRKQTRSEQKKYYASVSLATMHISFECAQLATGFVAYYYYYY